MPYPIGSKVPKDYHAGYEDACKCLCQLLGRIEEVYTYSDTPLKSLYYTVTSGIKDIIAIERSMWRANNKEENSNSNQQPLNATPSAPAQGTLPEAGNVV